MSTVTPQRIYLASKSPRRRELLKQIGVNFEVLLLRLQPRTGDVDETPHVGEGPEDYVQRVCQEKVEMGWKSLKLRNLPIGSVLAADTCVILDGQIVGKPENREHAADILQALSGRQHQVYSAVAITFDGRMEMRMSSSKVTFATLSKERIRNYLLTNESLDKAGAYAIQGYAAAFIVHLEGSYSGVMGLPLFETAEILQNFGYPIL
ncbi:MAG: nucleoside triphosphate pyrophosphatase [Candidatus Nitrotoga sp.]